MCFNFKKFVKFVFCLKFLTLGWLRCFLGICGLHVELISINKTVPLKLKDLQISILRQSYKGLYPSLGKPSTMASNYNQILIK